MLKDDLNKEIKNIREKTGIDIIYVDENVCNSMLIPEHCGVYIITTKSGKRYVGSSKNILKRLYHHVSIDNIREGKHIKEPITSISVYLTDDERGARLLEHWFMLELDPELNYRKPNKYKMWTVQLDDDIYKVIIDKKLEICKKYGIHLTIAQIISVCMKNGIEEIEKLLGFEEKLEVKT